MTTERPVPADTSRPPALSLTNPTDLLAAVPYLLGFHPHNSLVIVGVAERDDRRAVCCSARCDLPPSADEAPAVATVLLQPVRESDADFVALVGYGPAARVTPCVDAVRGAVRGAGIELRDAFRLTAGRYWSYLCTGACCPAEGVPFAPEDSLVPATMVAAGLSTCADRAELAAAVAPATGEQARAVWRATEQIVRSRRGVSMQSALRAVRAAARRVEAGEPDEPAEELARLCVAVTDIRVRDEAWTLIHPVTAERHLRLWQRVFRSAPCGYRAAPGSLAAFAAWQCGQGALANLALDRVLADDPGYTMALLLRRALQSGLPPHRWSAVGPAQDGGS